jgi:hypothetical protein
MFDKNKVDINGICRQSVNWRHDDNAVDYTRHQRNESDRTYKHKGGVVVIRTDDLEYVRDNRILAGDFDFEVKPEYNGNGNVINKYHGNLLLANMTCHEKRELKFLAEQLALFAILICEGPEDA